MPLQDFIGLTITTPLRHDQIARATMWDVGSCIASQRPATWEGSVLPALREACDAHPELRGVVLTCSGVADGRILADLALPNGRHTSRGRAIRVGTAAHVLADASQAAVEAASVIRAVSERLASLPPCPVCQAMPGWVCSSCRAPEQPVAVAPRFVAESTELLRTTDQATQAVQNAAGTFHGRCWRAEEAAPARVPWAPAVGQRVVLPDLATARTDVHFIEHRMADLCGRHGEVRYMRNGRVQVESDGLAECWYWEAAHLRPEPTDPREQLCATS